MTDKIKTLSPSHEWKAHKCTSGLYRPYPTVLCSAGCTFDKNEKEIEEMHYSMRDLCSLINKDILEKRKREIKK